MHPEESSTVPPPSQVVTYAVLENYIRNMDTQLFLSEYQLNAFYLLLLLNHSSPWDNIIPSLPETRAQVELLIDDRVKLVEGLLAEIFDTGVEKQMQKNLLTTEKLTDILNANHKSIRISKIPPGSRYYEPQNQQLFHEVMEVFTGIGRIVSMAENGAWKYVEYCPVERFVTFKIGTRYLMTARNHDEILFDERSRLSCLPREMFINGIFPFLNAEDIFLLRGVCKEWKRHVKDSWMFCFKREMRSQIILTEFCKDIEEFYKLIQLRNLVYQKLTVLMYALSELIEWPLIHGMIESGEISQPLKRVLMVLIRLIGQHGEVPIYHVSDLTDVHWNILRPKALNLGELLKSFLQDSQRCVMSITQLSELRLNILSNPFMRMEEIGSVDKSPLLACLMTKLLTLQTTLKNHILLTQEYLVCARKRLDGVYKGLSPNRGFLEAANRIVLSFGKVGGQEQQQHTHTKSFSMSNFLRSLHTTDPTRDQQTPDFSLNGKNSRYEFFIDNATKMDILLCTLRRTPSEATTTQQ